MLVQLFLEEDLKQINLRLLLFQKNFNLEEELADLMTTELREEAKNGKSFIDSDEVIEV
jgi:hypothetical protein